MREKKCPDEFLSEVKASFPPDFLVQAREELEVYGKDWTRVFSPDPSAVVFPRSTEEVSRFLRLCSKYEVAVVPSGGRTGLAGGAVASQGEVVLSLDRMKRMEPVDPLALTVHVEAGAVTEAVHQHCLPHSLTWPVDFASKGSSQVGGNISTNAGGVKVIRYGLTRNWVLGLRVVLMDGTILSLNGALEKNNTGIDLRQLFIGSEGILGVITEATLKLTRLPGELQVFFFAVKDIPSVLRLFEKARKGPFEIAAFECLTSNCLKLVTEMRGLQSPLSSEHGMYVLLEVEQTRLAGASQTMDEWLSELFETGLIEDGTLAQSPREARELWTLREGISESLATRGRVHKNDIALPLAQQEAFIAEMYRVLNQRNPEIEVYLFGHIGDGNLHVNTMKPASMDIPEFQALCKNTDQDLFTLIQKYQGSISAEHGIGLLKKDHLHYSRSPEEILIMKNMKKVLDPKELLNPGKVF